MGRDSPTAYLGGESPPGLGDMSPVARQTLSFSAPMDTFWTTRFPHLTGGVGVPGMNFFMAGPHGLHGTPPFHPINLAMAQSNRSLMEQRENQGCRPLLMTDSAGEGLQARLTSSIEALRMRAKEHSTGTAPGGSIESPARKYSAMSPVLGDAERETTN
ncbi:hypothetical protein C0Q70_19852 [Pomacea canaliculata]|uniref:OAR domain-containing protein n=1 Tax=Pomacea canaliculata TaxID=400727 RepID=A0A2T7NDW3_POMCA|nr:hypothetical protein C0Q70_19852 [Pomacea canaliculata]